MTVPKYLFFAVLWFAVVSAEAADSRFDCGGQVEAEVWSVWDSRLRGFIEQQQLRDRLLKRGDVYALYDVQTYTHNVVSMARRCNRQDRLREIATLIRIAYDALEPGTPASPGRRWICRGGSTCNDTNRLLNKEVALDSVQFLALAASVANALASSKQPPGPEKEAFVEDTARVAVEHLLRWGDIADETRLRKAIRSTPGDMDGSSALIFTDRELWLITVYAELAGIGNADLGLSDEDHDRLRRHLTQLLRFFSARLSIRKRGTVDLADVDRAYWSSRAENRYAGYESEEKPVVCASSENGDKKPEVRVPASTVSTRADTGWDISHARRLVHALDALERNRGALMKTFGVSRKELPRKGIARAFANTLLKDVWNGDTAMPLFSNYWSGANGWFRVAYDNGTGACREGYPPYGMSDSFATGGYIVWAQYRPQIGVLGRRLYDLAREPDEEGAAFITKYYPTLSKQAGAQSNALAKLMFLPTLVGPAGGSK
ncbi:MAG: hypothetical protein V7606_676 [Burkholderiales bacterium]